MKRHRFIATNHRRAVVLSSQAITHIKIIIDIIRSEKTPITTLTNAHSCSYEDLINLCEDVSNNVSKATEESATLSYFIPLSVWIIRHLLYLRKCANDYVQECLQPNTKENKDKHSIAGHYFVCFLKNHGGGLLSLLKELAAFAYITSTVCSKNKSDMSCYIFGKPTMQYALQFLCALSSHVEENKNKHDIHHKEFIDGLKELLSNTKSSSCFIESITEHTNQQFIEMLDLAPSLTGYIRTPSSLGLSSKKQIDCVTRVCPVIDTPTGENRAAIERKKLRICKMCRRVTQHEMSAIPWSRRYCAACNHCGSSWETISYGDYLKQ